MLSQNHELTINSIYEIFYFITIKLNLELFK